MNNNASILIDQASDDHNEPLLQFKLGDKFDG